MHHTDKGVSFWVDARQALRSPSSSEKAYIVVPSSNILEKTPPLELFSTAGVQKEAFIESFDQLLRGMIDRRTKNACFPLSFFDLFCGGLTNICRSIYFGTDLAVVLSQSNIVLENLEQYWGMGGAEHDFLFDFVKFLIAQHLAHVDFSDSLIDIVDRGMTPTFIASLTWRGRRFVSFVQANEVTLIDRGIMTAGHGVYVAQEAFVEMVAYSLEARLKRIFLFQKNLPA